jgi:L-threonylcarbamoyladenylate synthase
MDESNAKKIIASAAAIIKSGGLVAFPTETVYGLGADARNEHAVARIFTVKKRPHFDPLIVHIGARSQLDLVAADIPDTAQRLMAAFWPGPLTVVVAKTAAIADLVTAGLSSVAVRMPGKRIARDLILAAETPVAAPSANSFGRISPTSAEHVRADLGNAVDMILDGGPCEVGIESTIVSCVHPVPVLLRPGGVPLEAIQEAVGEVIVPDPSDRTHVSPGRFKRHYAPRTPLVLCDTPKSPPQQNRVGLLSFREPPSRGEYACVEVLSPSGDLAEAACGLFAALKRLDAAGLDLIVAARVPEEGLGRAINDRLRRAAQDRGEEAEGH